MPSSAADRFTPIDMHVHFVGNGLGGSGCWLRLGFWHKPLAAWMVKHIGMRVQPTDPAWDEEYVAHLARLVRESSMSAAVLLAQDEVYHADGRKMEGAGSFYVPNEFVFKVAREHPEFLPACSIHPARPDALEELERCLEAGAVLMKCLPNCHNIDCNDARYRRFWERMAEAGLPLLAHTGGEHTVPVIEPKYADPRVLRLPLECGVNVIAAHCATKSGLFDPEYFHVLVKMFDEHPNLYADTSAFNVPVRGRFVRECLTEKLAPRLVHGSDFPVPVLGHWRWLQGIGSRADLRRCQAIKNVIERDYQFKLAWGFPPEHFTRIHVLLRKSQGVASGASAPGL
ncbi:MAG TPA: amidohydrolase family protein [Chthoniobacteraceae bacterium]|nr:amidohydrolase family protein [Chthoniobacteraceae bacterium]